MITIIKNNNNSRSVPDYFVIKIKRAPDLAKKSQAFFPKFKEIKVSWPRENRSCAIETIPSVFSGSDDF